MKTPVSLTTLALVLFAAFAYASPCTDRRITCASEFSEAVRSCSGDEKCVAQAHHTYMQCLAVDECSY